ncbi:enoyl-CoA hydratase/isomerase family protein [Ornithinimicrobium cryptoxanthini]|uniref:enoyl-CoA hydratase/isomerase family protein n=1 Tax=Ornithinimicrobium cryptoxanthini TaxID=2934161 RepID=UPI0021193F81|nr:enoyl-CoA hydratase-related protein [Ornithinimicrobium cryptoxanthini]
MELETIDLAVADGIAVATLNRPEVRNALNAQVLSDLQAVLDRVHSDDAIGALVLTGAGEKAFAAGADINQVLTYDIATGLASRMQRVYDAVEQCEKPTIAAVNGFALGGGCELAMACDIRIASDNARFGLPELTLGVLPGAGGTQRLSRLVGVGRAVEMILTSRILTAEESREMGLVTSVVPQADLVASARHTAATILTKGPIAVRLAKTVIRAGFDADRHTGQVIEQLAQTVLYATTDKTEGATAFLDKRPPQFTGR